MTHHHHHDTVDDQPFETRVVKLLEHWIKHNQDHAVTYRDWASRARDHHMDETAAILEEVAEMTALINQKFADLLGTVKT